MKRLSEGVAVALLAIAWLVGRVSSAQTISPQQECVASRAAGSRQQPGRTRFTMDMRESRFPMRSASLRRLVTCGFSGNRLLHANVVFYLTLISQDRENPGFTTGAPGMSQRFYLVCEGRVGTTLATFAAGQELSFDKNTFTLPCGHMIYRTGSTDPVHAERVSGEYAYRVRSATWKVRRGPTPTDPTFDVRLNVVVFNPVEVLHLSGRLLGELATTLTIVDCPQRQNSKQEPNPACR